MASDPGERDRVIVIEQRSAVDAVHATSGEPVEAWTTLVAQMPAKKLDLDGSEMFRGDQTSAKIEGGYQINYRLDMDPELVDVQKLRRLRVGTRILDIVMAKEIGRREEIALLFRASSQV